MGLKFLVRVLMVGSLSVLFTTGNLLSQTWTQDEVIKLKDDTKKGLFYLAPDVSLMLGTITQIRVSPAIGYHITDRFSIAVGGSYEFYKTNFRGLTNYQTHIWGVRSFARFDLIKDLGKVLPLHDMGIFAHLEYEGLMLDSDYFRPIYDGMYWSENVLLGAGIIQKAGPKVAITFMILWDIYANTSVYNGPVLRFGFQFYF